MRTPAVASMVAIIVLLIAGPATAGKRVTAAGVTLEPPAGWKLTSLPDGNAQFASAEGDIVWRLFPTEPATDLSAWFDDAAQAITSVHTNVEATPPEDMPTKTGLRARAAAGVLVDAAGTTHILMLIGFGDGKRVAPALIEFRTQDSLSRLAAIAPAFETIKLLARSAKPKSTFAKGGWRYPLTGAAAPQPAAATTTGSASGSATTPPTTPPADTANLPFLGTWSVGQSATNASGSVSYGSRLLQYNFLPDGTYTYHSEAWGGTFNSNWRYIVDEKGVWTASGDQLTVTAKSVTGVVRDLQGNIQKKGGPKPEKVTYRFQTTYFSGLKETQLVLTPPQATDRDGAFASNPSFPRSYLMRSAADYKPAFRYAP